MGKRKRTCDLCSESDDSPRKFPANSKESVQRQWIERLGLSPVETTEKLTDYRLRIAQGGDIRWCSSHFTTSFGLPKDLRPDPSPSLQIRELRPELQLDRLQQRYRNASSVSTPTMTPAVSDCEMDTDEGGLATPPRPLSPIRRPSSPLILDYRNYDFYNDANEILPKRFKTQSSIRTETTTDKGSEYVVSELDTEESDVEERSEDGKERGSKAKYRMVGHEQLLELFRRCGECGELLDRSQVKVGEEGSACTVKYDCLKCGKSVTWHSQEKIGKGNSKVYEGNQEIAIGAFITGVPIPRLEDFAKLIGFRIPTERSMRRNIRDIACPAIERVFTQWQTHVRQLSKDVAEADGIAVAIDGMHCTPGFNARNCKVCAMDARLKLALAGATVHKDEQGIDGVSIRMESVGSLRVLEELIDDGFLIKTRVSDQNRMVDKKLREHPKTAHIVAEYDWWHTQKPLKKLWWKAMKGSPVIAQLYLSFFAHLYYCHKKYTAKEDRPKALELVLSFLMHVQGKHSWKKGDNFKFVTKCDHEKLKRRKRGDPPRPTLKADSKEYKLIEEMLHSPHFQKAFLNSSALIDTALNESFHSLSLLYCPKRLACSPFFYNIKMKLSMLHYNSLILHEMMGLRQDKRASLLPRPGRVALSVKTKREPGQHPWREEIIVESERVREELEDGRLMKRIGMPSDLVFDELCAEEGRNGQGRDEEEEWEDETFEEGVDEEEEEEEYEL